MGRPRKQRMPKSKVYLGADGKWHCWVTIGRLPDGRLDRRERSGRDKDEVIRKALGLEDDLAAGRAPKPGRAPTVEQWFTSWLSTIANRPPRALAPRTLDDYWSKCRNWVFPHVGWIRLRELEADDLDRLYTTMHQAGKAQSHVLKVHAIVRRGLEIAVRREKVHRNVAQLIESPSSRALKITPYEQGEARRILAVAGGRRNPARWSVGLSIGLRQGEALGLMWPYIDLEELEVSVEWQLQRLTWEHGCEDPYACGRRRHVKPCPGRGVAHRRRHVEACPKPCAPDCSRHASLCPARRPRGVTLRPGEGIRHLAGGLYLTPPKDGARVVPLPPELVPEIRAQRKAQAAERLAAGELWADHGLVFATKLGGPIDPRRDWQEWKDIVKAAGVRPGRLHDARHTAGTLLLEHGVDIRVVQDILGHSDLRMTQQYTKTTSKLARDAAEKIGAALFGRFCRATCRPPVYQMRSGRNQMASDLGRCWSRLRESNSGPTHYESFGSVVGTGRCRSHEATDLRRRPLHRPTPTTDRPGEFCRPPCRPGLSRSGTGTPARTARPGRRCPPSRPGGPCA
jgi:integrase